MSTTTLRTTAILVGTRWEQRLDPVHLEPMPAQLAEVEIYHLRNEVRADKVIK